jgi:hypothetical protein
MDRCEAAHRRSEAAIRHCERLRRAACEEHYTDEEKIMRKFNHTIALLHPDLQALVARFGSYWSITEFAKAHPGVNLEVFETYRTKEDQLRAFRDGTSEVDGHTRGFAPHCCTPTLAVDLVVESDGEILGVLDGRLTWGKDSLGAYREWGKFAKANGFIHGGLDWGWDWPHAQVPMRDIWKMVQRMLNDTGANLVVDGMAGPKTWAAVQRFADRLSVDVSTKRLTNVLWDALYEATGRPVTP